jgi:hypothetical protein
MTRINDPGFYVGKEGLVKHAENQKMFGFVGDGGSSFMATVMTIWFAIDLDLDCKQTKEKPSRRMSGQFE